MADDKKPDDKNVAKQPEAAKTEPAKPAPKPTGRYRVLVGTIVTGPKQEDMVGAGDAEPFVTLPDDEAGPLVAEGVLEAELA